MKNLYVSQINTGRLSVEDQKLLCKILMIRPNEKEEYDLENGIKKEICLSTRVKQKFNSTQSFLIFYKSEIEFPSIHTNLITILNSSTDSKAFKDLTTDPSYYIIGVDHIRPLLLPESHYILKQLNHSIDEQKQICRHHTRRNSNISRT